MSNKHTMPEGIWAIDTNECEAGTWDTGKDPGYRNLNYARYLLKSTVDNEIAQLHKLRRDQQSRIQNLDGDLMMSNDSIRLSREHLKKAGISAGFFDDCAALAAKKILDQQETIRELSFTLEIIVEQSSDNLAVGSAKQALADNATRIAEANKSQMESINLTSVEVQERENE